MLQCHCCVILLTEFSILILIFYSALHYKQMCSIIVLVFPFFLHLTILQNGIVPTLQQSTLLAALQSAVKAGGVLLPISGYTPLSIVLHDTVGPFIAVSERARQHKDGTDPAWRDMWSVSGQHHPDRWQQLKHLWALL